MIRSGLIVINCLLLSAPLANLEAAPPTGAPTTQPSGIAPPRDSIVSRSDSGKAKDSLKSRLHTVLRGDSSLLPRNQSTARKDSLKPAGQANSVDSLPPPPFLIPSFGWSLGAGAPSFPFRERFRSELATKAQRDTLMIDQPWDGSQLGFATGCELGLQHDFLRAILGAEWTFWDSRSVSRNPRTGELSERTWRVDQLMGLAGLDMIMPRRLLTVTGATEPHFGFRAAWGVGRLVGTGRAWAYGGGWQAHLGADVTSFGPFVLGGRMGWSSLRLTSDRTASHVLFDDVGSDHISWNGSGLWLNMVIRLRPTPPVAPKPKADVAPQLLNPRATDSTKAADSTKATKP